MQTGDIFYTQREKDGFTPFKIIKVDDEGTTYHTRVYETLDHQPQESEIGTFSIMCGISPFASTAFSSPVVLVNAPVTKEEQDNFLEYLMLSEQFQKYCFAKAEYENITIEELIAKANVHYKKSSDAFDKNDYEEVISELTACVNLFPLLYEAYDNRGLAYLDTDRIDLAKEDFETSLKINPGGALAIKKLNWIALHAA